MTTELLSRSIIQWRSEHGEEENVHEEEQEPESAAIGRNEGPSEEFHGRSDLKGGASA